MHRTASSADRRRADRRVGATAPAAFVALRLFAAPQAPSTGRGIPT